MSDPNAAQPGDPNTPPPAPEPAAEQPQYQQPPQAPQQPPQQPQYAAPAANAPYSPETDRQLGMWANIGGVVGFLPSLIIWLIGKDRGPVTNVEAKEALNWQITFTIGYVALLIITTILNGFLLFTPVPFLTFIIGLLPFALWVLNIIWSIMGGVRVNAGGSWRYPINFRFIK